MSRKVSGGILREARTVLEEADETLYWLEVTEEAELLPGSKLRELAKEADELTAIFTAARKTLQDEA